MPMVSAWRCGYAAAVSMQFCRMAAPFAVAHVLVHAHELARDRDQQADGLLGDFDGVATGRVADLYAELFGGREIHPVDTDAGTANHLGFLQLRDDIFGEGHRAVHDNPVRVTTHFNDFRVVGGPRQH